MDRWQTTVRGSNWKEINDAAREAVFSFFLETRYRTRAMETMKLDIQPSEYVVSRGYRGEVLDERVESYEATVSVEL